jgi:hypothetical protein
MSNRTLTRINEYAIVTLMKETGATRETALKIYRLASGDFLLAKTALCNQFEDNRKRLAWLRNEAKEAAYRREQSHYHQQVDALKAKRTERESVAHLKARCLGFQVRVAIDVACDVNAFPYEDYYV